jgi:hypothetical protein
MGNHIYLRNRELEIMNVYLMTFLFSVITYGLGYYAGNSDGKVEGRMAVRRHYEERERQLKVNR